MLLGFGNGNSMWPMSLGVSRLDLCNVNKFIFMGKGGNTIACNGARTRLKDCVVL